MNYSKFWNVAEEFTVSQATALWCGVEPDAMPQYEPQGVADFRAVKHMLSSAIRRGELSAQHTATAKQFGDYSSAIISRLHLQYWAEAKDMRPAFLFDTLLNAPEDWAGMDENGTVFSSPVHELQRTSFEISASEKLSSPAISRRAATEETPGTTAPASTVPKARGGRPQEYDWDAMLIEVLRIADMDGLPEKRSDLTKKLLQWFSTNFNKEPAASEVSKRVATFYSSLERIGWQPKGGAHSPTLKTAKG